MPPPAFSHSSYTPWGGCACTAPACARSLAPIGDFALRKHRTRTNGLTEILVSRRGKHTLKTTLPGARLSTNMVLAAAGARLAPGRGAGSPLWGAKHLQEARNP